MNMLNAIKTFLRPPAEPLTEKQIADLAKTQGGDMTECVRYWDSVLLTTSSTGYDHRRSFLARLL